MVKEKVLAAEAIAPSVFIFYKKTMDGNKVWCTQQRQTNILMI